VTFWNLERHVLATPKTSRVHSTRPRGFSLLESIAVVLGLGVVCWVVIPRLSGNSLELKQNACYTNRGNIEIQAELWYRNKETWPATDLSDIRVDPVYFPDDLPKCPVDGSGYVLDSTTHRVVGHEHSAP
jgi:type II secretory pathway pseudopilin PulG